MLSKWLDDVVAKTDNLCLMFYFCSEIVFVIFTVLLFLFETKIVSLFIEWCKGFASAFFVIAIHPFQYLINCNLAKNVFKTHKLHCIQVYLIIDIVSALLRYIWLWVPVANTTDTIKLFLLLYSQIFSLATSSNIMLICI